MSEENGLLMQKYIEIGWETCRTTHCIVHSFQARPALGGRRQLQNYRPQLL